jgi:hypothetical protein
MSVIIDWFEYVDLRYWMDDHRLVEIRVPLLHFKCYAFGHVVKCIIFGVEVLCDFLLDDFLESIVGHWVKLAKTDDDYQVIGHPAVPELVVILQVYFL